MGTPSHPVKTQATMARLSGVAILMLLSLSQVDTAVGDEIFDFTFSGIPAWELEAGKKIPIRATEKSTNLTFQAGLWVQDSQLNPIGYSFLNQGQRCRIHPEPPELGIATEGRNIILSLRMRVGKRKCFKRALESLEKAELRFDVDYQSLKPHIAKLFNYSLADQSLLQPLELPDGTRWNPTGPDFWSIVSALHTNGAWQHGRWTLDFSRASPRTSFPALAGRQSLKQQPWRLVRLPTFDELELTDSSSDLPIQAQYQAGKYRLTFEMPDGDFAIYFAGGFHIGFENRVRDRGVARVIEKYKPTGIGRRLGQSAGITLKKHPRDRYVSLAIDWATMSTIASDFPWTGKARRLDLILTEPPYMVTRVDDEPLPNPTAQPEVEIPPFPDPEAPRHISRLTLSRDGSVDRVLEVRIDQGPLPPESPRTEPELRPNDHGVTQDLRKLLIDLRSRLEESRPEDLQSPITVSIDYPQPRFYRRGLSHSDTGGYLVRLPRETLNRKIFKIRYKNGALIRSVVGPRTNHEIPIDAMFYSKDREDLLLAIDYFWPVDLFMPEPREIPDHGLIRLEGYAWEVTRGGAEADTWRELLAGPVYLNRFAIRLLSSIELSRGEPSTFQAKLTSNDSPVPLVELEIEARQALAGDVTGKFLVGETDNVLLDVDANMIRIARSDLEKAMAEGTTISLAVRQVEPLRALTWEGIIRMAAIASAATVFLLLASMIYISLRNRTETPAELDAHAFGSFAEVARETSKPAETDA